VTGIGVIGAGVAGRTHLAALRSIPDVTVTGICDLDTDRRGAAARDFGVPEQDDPEALIGDHRTQAVVIATSDDQHTAAAIRAAELGRHVLVEKPLATTPGDAERIVAAHAAAGTVLATGHCLRFHADYRALHTAIGEGRLGRLIALVGGRCRASDVHDRLAGRVSLAMYLGTHEFDLVRWLSHEQVIAVSAATPDLTLYPLPALTVTLQLDAGTLATVHLNWCSPQGHPSISYLHAFGTDGAVLVGGPQAAMVEIDDHGSHITSRALGAWVDGRPPEIFMAQAAAFSRVIGGDGWGAMATGEDGLRAVEIAAAVERSARTRAEVTL
jgi:predicted dehydrogenase